MGNAQFTSRRQRRQRRIDRRNKYQGTTEVNRNPRFKVIGAIVGPVIGAILGGIGGFSLVVTKGAGSAWVIIVIGGAIGGGLAGVIIGWTVGAISDAIVEVIVKAKQ